MKARIPWKPARNESKAMKAEINKQILDADREYANALDAVVLYTLHTQLGFGKKRLRRFWEAMRSEHEKLVEHYQMPEDRIWLADHKLKEIGVDVAAWNKEVENK